MSAWFRLADPCDPLHERLGGVSRRLQASPGTVLAADAIERVVREPTAAAR